MLRLPAFRWHQPEDAEAATGLLQSYPDAILMAGGTDLLPAMKTGQIEAAEVISLRRIVSDQVRRQQGQLYLGAGLTLAELSQHPGVLAAAPALAQAALLVGSPLIRNRATLGGNLCLEPRCRYLNQSRLFRQALGGCLKSHGDRCHVVPGGTRCVAALSADLVPVLVALRAQVLTTHRQFPLVELYRSDGLRPRTLEAGEWIEEVSLAEQSSRMRVAYRKWRSRQSIDFPLVSVALRLDLEGQRLAGGVLVVGVIGPKPRCIDLEQLAGRPVDAELASSVVELARGIRPLPNVPYDPDYRRQRLCLEIGRAVQQCQ